MGNLISVAKGTELELPVMILATCGLRRGELLALRWKDIDLGNNIISIEHNLVAIKGRHTVTKDPKSASGKRKIEIPYVLTRILEKARTDYLRNKSQYGESFHDTDLVVCQSDGSAYYPDYFSQKFKKLLLRNNLKIIRLHDMRHTNATFMLNLGVNPKVMQKRLGHSTFSTTMDTYSHVLDDMGKEAAEKLEAGLRDLM